ncbi:MAG: NAD(P)H-binding protein [Pseudomonadota bacterium]
MSVRDPTDSQTGPKKVLLLGATGTIGCATAEALTQAGHRVTCVVRRRGGGTSQAVLPQSLRLPPEITLRFADVTDAVSLRSDGLREDAFDVLISCLASRDGTPKDAWAIDDAANRNAIAVAQETGIAQVILLSAICVQKPRLAFQHAKLSSEKALIDSGLTYSIVRPTAFFKSLSGQIERVQEGKPFLLFGDGTLTACKPISDRDLAAFLVGCIADPTRRNQILPIGGPGPAITPRDQGEALFDLLGTPPKFRQVPLALFAAICSALAVLGRVAPSFATKAELARIGQYYATESMLVLNPNTGRYDAEATPSYGEDRLFDFYRQVLDGTATVERGDHSVF